MSRTILVGMTLALAMQAAASAGAAPVTTDDFTVATAGNLVALCTSDSSDPLFTPARNFCHGFAMGTYRLIAMEEAASRRKAKLFCIPDNPPTRDQAIAAFSQWASGRPKTLQGTPTDAIIELPDRPVSLQMIMKDKIVRKMMTAVVAVGLLAGCSDLNYTQQRALTGTVGGAGVGAVLGAIGGNAGLGAAAGAGAGLLGGLVYDKVQKDQRSAYDEGYVAGRRRY